MMTGAGVDLRDNTHEVVGTNESGIFQFVYIRGIDYINPICVFGLQHQFPHRRMAVFIAQ
jgi:hypothetical protein